MELWDAYDEQMNIIPGKTLIRDEKIPDGMFHFVSAIIVRHSDGTYLLMQRDTRKSYGGMWEATAGGSTLKGETPMEGAYRELFEETGIKAENLIPIGTETKIEHNTHYASFLCITDCPKDSIVLQKGETIAYKWATRDEIYAMPKTELVTRRNLEAAEESDSLPQWGKGDRGSGG